MRQVDKCSPFCITSCAYTSATSNERGTYIATHEHCHNNSSMDKQQHDTQTHKLGKASEPNNQFLKNTLSLTNLDYVQYYFGLRDIFITCFI